MCSRYGSVCSVLDHFATFLTLMSRAWSDLSDDSTESKSVPHGRVTATAFTPTIASELRLKSDSRKMHYGAQTHAQADNCLQSADPSAKAHTTSRLRSKHGDKDGFEASADILALVTSGGARATVPHSNLIEQARRWQGSDTSTIPHHPTSVSHTLRGGSPTHRGYGLTQSKDPNRDLSSRPTEAANTQAASQKAHTWA